MIGLLGTRYDSVSWMHRKAFPPHSESFPLKKDWHNPGKKDSSKLGPPVQRLQKGYLFVSLATLPQNRAKGHDWGPTKRSLGVHCCTTGA